MSRNTGSGSIQQSVQQQYQPFDFFPAPHTASHPQRNAATTQQFGAGTLNYNYGYNPSSQWPQQGHPIYTAPYGGPPAPSRLQQARSHTANQLPLQTNQVLQELIHSRHQLQQLRENNQQLFTNYSSLEIVEQIKLRQIEGLALFRKLYIDNLVSAGVQKDAITPLGLYTGPIDQLQTPITASTQSQVPPNDIRTRPLPRRVEAAMQELEELRQSIKENTQKRHYLATKLSDFQKYIVQLDLRARLLIPYKLQFERAYLQGAFGDNTTSSTSSQVSGPHFLVPQANRAHQTAAYTTASPTVAIPVIGQRQPSHGRPIASSASLAPPTAIGTPKIIDLTDNDDETTTTVVGPANSPNNSSTSTPRLSLPDAGVGSFAEPLTRNASQGSDTATSDQSGSKKAITPPTRPPTPEWRRKSRNKPRSWMNKTTRSPAEIHALGMDKQFTKPNNDSPIISYNDYQTQYDPNFTAKARDAAVKAQKEKKKQLVKEDREKRMAAEKEQQKQSNLKRRIQRKKHDELVETEKKKREEYAAKEKKITEDKKAAEEKKITEERKAAEESNATEARQAAQAETARQKRERDSDEEDAAAASHDSTPGKMLQNSKRQHLGVTEHSKDTDGMELDAIIPLDEGDDDIFGEVAEKKQRWEEQKARFRKQIEAEEAAALRQLRKPRKTTKEPDAKAKAQEEKEDKERQCRELREELRLKDEELMRGLEAAAASPQAEPEEDGLDARFFAEKYGQKEEVMQANLQLMRDMEEKAKLQKRKVRIGWNKIFNVPYDDLDKENGAESGESEEE